MYVWLYVYLSILTLQWVHFAVDLTVITKVIVIICYIHSSFILSMTEFVIFCWKRQIFRMIFFLAFIFPCKLPNILNITVFFFKNLCAVLFIQSFLLNFFIKSYQQDAKNPCQIFKVTVFESQSNINNQSRFSLMEKVTQPNIAITWNNIQPDIWMKIITNYFNAVSSWDISCLFGIT